MNKQQSVSSTTITQNLKSGPVAIIRDEDGVDLSPTLTHLRKIGFANIVVMGLKAPVEPDVLFMEIEPSAETFELINSLIVPLSGRWIYYAHNAEYLYFPFCEGRSISDVAQFVEEERRESVFCTTVDLYPSQIDRNELILHSEDAHFDEEGYFSRDRFDGADKLERQIDVFGGLKWRYAEHIEWTRQRIDRIAFFKAKAGLQLDNNGLFNEPEMNTITCPWHHNLTFCVASFRVAKSLLNNPGSTYEIETFMWDRSAKFDWTSQQLMDRGLMEPGQWF